MGWNVGTLTHEVSDGPTARLLVFVTLGRVDVPVPDLQSILDTVVCLLCRHLVHAKAKLGDLLAVEHLARLSGIGNGRAERVVWLC